MRSSRNPGATSSHRSEVLGQGGQGADKDNGSAAPASKVASGPLDARRAPGISLGANDGPVDDFLDLVENWEDASGQGLLPNADATYADPGFSRESNPREALERIAADFSPQQMRQLGGSLLKLADALDQEWHPDAAQSRYHWITNAGRIERNSLELSQTAIRLRDQSRHRSRFLSSEFFGEPAWEMLLELFIQFSGHAEVSTKSLTLVSGVSDTTALRLIDKLEVACLIERRQSQVDKRVTLVSLTRQGLVAVGSILAAN